MGGLQIAAQSGVQFPRRRTIEVKIFTENTLLVAKHNAKYAKGLGVLQVGPWTSLGDFAAAWVRQNGQWDTAASRTRNSGPHLFHQANLNDSSLPTTVDWAQEGSRAPVKNQGQCGSCWAFSTTGSLEGQHFRKTESRVTGEQNLVDCSDDFGNQGCNGGLMDNGFQYIKANGGIDTEETTHTLLRMVIANSRRLMLAPPTLVLSTSNKVQRMTSRRLWLLSAPSRLLSMQATAPSSSTHRVSTTSPTAAVGQLDHGVLTVGYGVKNGKKYWLVKNSWGETGETMATSSCPETRTTSAVSPAQLATHLFSLLN
uniref:Cathepsin L-like tick cysteine proteinase A n=1 Tax=Haemaphysalis longicornis TaxID=44386 RepID=O96087_HAELO|nr:cathepsin L-like tick cysteine proteinase A [Haemaphysalis longicornis]